MQVRPPLVLGVALQCGVPVLEGALRCIREGACRGQLFGLLVLSGGPPGLCMRI